jgi:hypothetical protein
VASACGTRCRRTLILAVLLLGTLVVLPSPASASEILTRDAKYVSIKVGNKGMAVVNYKINGKWQHPLVWGAINARTPSKTVKQVHFKIDYSGGWGTFRKPIWKTMKNGCQPYDGPALPWVVTACKAPDGSYWALQRWQRMLPNLGMKPWRADQKVWELHISHWRGELPVIEVYLDWIYSQKFHHLFGRFTYQGHPVHGFINTHSGNPLDTYGRNIYVDTFNSAYGKGWKRENSFLMHKMLGNFCYGFYMHDRYPGYPRGPKRPKGHGDKYRWRIMGPGVTPVVGSGTTGLEDYNPFNSSQVDYENAMNDLGDTIHQQDPKCQQH